MSIRATDRLHDATDKMARGFSLIDKACDRDIMIMVAKEIEEAFEEAEAAMIDIRAEMRRLKKTCKDA